MEDRVVQIRLSLENFRRLDALVTGSIRAYKFDHPDRVITSSLAKRIYKQLWAAAKEGQFAP